MLDKGNFWAGFVQKFPVKCFTSRLGKDWGTLGNLVNKGLDSKKSRSPPKPLLRAWDTAFQQWVEGCVTKRWFYALPSCLDLLVVLSLHLALSMTFSSSRSQKKKKKRKKNRKYCKRFMSTAQPALQSAWVTVVTPSPNAVLFLPNFMPITSPQARPITIILLLKSALKLHAVKNIYFSKRASSRPPSTGFEEQNLEDSGEEKRTGYSFHFMDP